MEPNKNIRGAVIPSCKNGARLLLAAVACMSAAVSSAKDPPAITDPLRWRQLAAIPDEEGVAGPFSGVSGGSLLVAGGANIAGDKWAASFMKKWHDTVFLLEAPAGAWRTVGKLPRPLGYGVSITADDRVVCIGGSDVTRHFAEVFQLAWEGGGLGVTPLPHLPKPCANMCGALLGRTIYVAGGIETPMATTALKSFWSFDLDDAEPHWRKLEPWPGPERMLAVAGIQDGSFFLLSGARLHTSADGKPVREFLRDAYRFTPRQGWERIADLPRAAVAAPSPAVPLGASRLLVLTGDDGANVSFQPIDRHPGFPRDGVVYDIGTDRWSIVGGVPFSRATVPTVQWGDRIIVPNGETRPRMRTPEVWSLELPAAP